MATGTRQCTAESSWEWAVTGYTPTETVTRTVSKSVTIYQTWRYYSMYGEWVRSGSSWESPSGGSNYRGSYPSAPFYSSHDGDTTTTSGSGTADFTETVTIGGDPIYGWVRTSSSHSHPSSISYDDGVYVGTLTLDSCNASASSPGFSGYYEGQTTTTVGSGTAYYSGNVTIKPTVPNSPANFKVSSQDATSVNLTWEAASGATTYSVEAYLKGNVNPVQTAYGLTVLAKYFTGLVTGQTYSFKLWAKNDVGNSIPVYINDFVAGGGRPKNWDWSTLVPTATTYTTNDKLRANLVSAKDWNDFVVRVNDFRKYKNMSAVSFSSAVTGTDFKATMYEQARTAIDAMKVSNNPNGYYSKLVALRESLNSIT